MAAAIVILGAIGLAAYTVNGNLEQYGATKPSQVVERDLEFEFTRRPQIGAMFYDIGSLNNEPGLPTNVGDRLPFVQCREANGVFGIQKKLYLTPTNTLVTIYSGTEHKMFV